MEKEFVRDSILKDGISIIICCFNSAKHLIDLLPHLEKLDRKDLALEIIVVDNLSTDSTFPLAETFFKSSQVKGRVLKESIPGLSFARKKGVLGAAYNLVLFCDDDNFFEFDYLQYGYKLFANNSKVGCLGGLGIPEINLKLPNWFEEFGSSYAVGSLGKMDGIQPIGSIHYGAGLFFRTEVLNKFYQRRIDSSLTDRKGKVLSSGGDSELCLAIQLEGYKLAYSPDLKFVHKIDSGRLKKSYYLKLRKGILSNFPILESYSLHLIGTQHKFVCLYLYRFPPLLLNFFKTLIKYLFRRSFVHKVQYLIYWWKMRGLILNFRTSYKLYKDLKSKYSL